MSDTDVSSDFTLRREDGVLTFTLTRDKKLNAFSKAMRQGLHDAVTMLADDASLRVLVIAAEGRYFTAGVDIAELAEQAGVDPDGTVHGQVLRRDYRRLHLLFDEIEACEKPVVLAVHAPCFGIGVELGSSCDFRLASDAATFALPEVVNLAVIPGSGGISRLTRIVGPHWARWLALACETVTAERALTMGFVHEVWPADSFAEKVDAFARRLASMPVEAVALAKLGIDLAASTDRKTARDFDRVANTVLLTSQDYVARMTAFNERSASRSQPKD